MDIDTALNVVSEYYKIDIKIIKNLLSETKKKHSNKDEIILPFCNYIFPNNCKGIVFNHGLYTQCSVKTKTDFCKKCYPQKYGRIEERIGIKKNEFVTKRGKKELPYEILMKKMNYSYEDVRDVLQKNGLTYDLEIENEKPTRGRPKNNKIIEEEIEIEIDVTKININGKEYYKTCEDVILNMNDYSIVGVYLNGKIED